MNLDTKRKIIEYLSKLMTEERWNGFKRVIEGRTRHVTVVLEDLYQPHNASAVLRSCDCFGVQDVHIIENTHEFQVSPDVALGSSKWLSMHRYNRVEHNTLNAYNALRDAGYMIVATSPHADDCMIDELPIDKKLALVFGTEKEGLSKVAMENADCFAKIPMYGFTESFNISVSAALSLFSVTERVRKSNIDWHLTEEESVDIMFKWVKESVRDSDKIIKLIEKS